MVNNADFIALKQIVKQHGLLEKQPWFYVGVVALKLGMFALSMAVLFTVDSFWAQVANALFLGFVLAQLGFTSHAACHRQCFHQRWQNDLVGIVLGNLLLGISRDWWTYKHNVHHAHPNHDGMDPDLDVPVVAFTVEQALSRRGVERLVVMWQAWAFFPLLTFQGYALRDVSLRYILDGKARQGRLEGLLLAVNLAWTFALPIMALGLWGGLGFALLSQAVFGVYLGSVFAPNHKGMLVVTDDMPIDFLRLQVLTARNVRAHALTDFWYGGLNYQIEHHLFPSVPMHRLRELSVLVKAFCAQRDVAYYETSMVQSYREILSYLHEIGGVLRRPAQASESPGA
ncbi:fatty acid desaturase [Oscillochloris sp. ZM17-4]|uniref:fatty acid desaturase family protein n=1 Tax=Oscillochloris sp. ZM17-4 TaxID=2866714 RepID=UPI001C735B40|nr:fatty acid desaturase [Oscillochloris sp. ZM17-4]MBX0327673.1 fatty acid desaturase [Oscillochloris sp. ZM17-4]